MAIFKTNLEAILASEAEVAAYYAAAASKINALLEKYQVRNAVGEIQQLSASKLRALLSYAGFFRPSPLKAIFFDGKQQFVPPEIALAFRSIVSAPPPSVKVVLLDRFIALLAQKGWAAPLGAYLERRYGVPPDGIVIVEDLKDFSLGFGVYQMAVQLRGPRREKAAFFLKKPPGAGPYNELLYARLQKKFLSAAHHAPLPCLLLGKPASGVLLLSPQAPGVVADSVLSLFAHALGRAADPQQKSDLEKALEVLIEAFIGQAALGDLLGRNDRHLRNALVAFVAEGALQTDALASLNSYEKILACAKMIATEKARAISLIGIDLKWLLGEKNTQWALADISFGLSELNLLSLLPAFNDYNAKTNLFLPERKRLVAHFFNIYCQQQQVFLQEKEFLFSLLKEVYPAYMAEEKLALLTGKIQLFENSKAPVVELFKRYLLDFRLRLAHKAALLALAVSARRANDRDLLNALYETGLLKYVPPSSKFVPSVFIQLQCFRGVLSKEDRARLAVQGRVPWEEVAASIAFLAEKFDGNLFEELEAKKQFVEEDTVALLEFLLEK